LRTRARGFSLVEVLVSVVILSIGLLGVAALQLAGLQYSQGAYQQSQATVAVADLVDRMRANPDLDGASAVYTFNTTSDAVPDAQTCISTGCAAAGLARADVRQWRTEVLPKIGPAANANVQLSGNVYTVTVSWDDIAERADGSEAG
jgi:type IV pilus assembly protein PilV